VNERRVRATLALLVGIGLRSLASLRSLAVASAGLSADVACTPTSGSHGGPPPNAQDGGSDAIVIGVELSISGNLAPFGTVEQTGAFVAENQINSLGGLLGHPVHFQIVDDASDVPTAGSAFGGFVNAGVVGVLGPSGSNLASATQPLAHSAMLPLISPSASTPTTREAEPCPDRYFFRTAASHALQARALALQAYRGLAPLSAGAPDAGPVVAGCRQLAVIHTDDTYGDPIATGIASETMTLGGQVIADFPVPATAQGQSYYATLTQSVISLAPQPDCQILVSLPDVGVAYMRAFKQATLADTSRDWSTFTTLGSNGLASDAFLVNGRDNPQDPSSPTAGEGIYVMNLDLNPATPEHQEFTNLYSLFYPLDAGQNAPGYAGNAYDAAILMALAIQAAGTATDRVRIRDALYAVSRPPGTAVSPSGLAAGLQAIQLGQDVNYEGASGPVDFDDCGEVVSGYLVSRVVAGQFQDVPEDAVSVADLQ
jgi:branched-chain amino acid transport system substrate-binding protein/neutral amino acid transport system substrate-binding protein